MVTTVFQFNNEPNMTNVGYSTDYIGYWTQFR